MMPSNDKQLQKAAAQLLAAIESLKRHSSPEDEGFHPPGIAGYPQWLHAWSRFEQAVDELDGAAGETPTTAYRQSAEPQY